MGRGSSKAGSARGGSATNEVVRGNTKFTITKASNGLYLNVSSVNGNTPTTKYKIAYAKNLDKARVYMGSFLGYLNFNSDPEMLKLLKNALK